MKDLRMFLFSEQELENLITKTVKIILKELDDKKELDKKYISRTEAAEILRVTPETVSNYVKKRWFKNYGKGRNILLLQSEVIYSIQHNNLRKWKR
jgi:hypothetical protein